MNYQNQEPNSRWTTPMNYENYQYRTPEGLDPLYYPQLIQNLINESNMKDRPNTDEPPKYGIIITQPDRMITQVRSKQNFSSRHNDSY